MACASGGPAIVQHVVAVPLHMKPDAVAAAGFESRQPAALRLGCFGGAQHPANAASGSRPLAEGLGQKGAEVGGALRTVRDRQAA